MKKIIPFIFLFFLGTLVLNAQQPMPGDLVGSHQGTAGITPSDGGLMVIDQFSGVGSTPLFHNPLVPYTDIDFRQDGMLFCEQGNGFDTLFMYNPKTGIRTIVGKHIFGGITGLEFVGNTLYGTFITTTGGTSALIVINQNDASFESIIPTGLNRVTGLAYDKSTGIMYGTEVIGVPPVACNLVTIDLNTGASALIGPVGYIVGGLEFDRNGVLYGATSRHGLNPGHLITISTSTGAGTVVGPTGYEAISGISFYPPQSVPFNYNIVIAIFIGLAVVRMFFLVYKK
jgi:hypothetical protein